MVDVSLKKLAGRTIEGARYWSDAEYLGISIEFTDGYVFELGIKPRSPLADQTLYRPSDGKEQRYRKLPTGD